MPTKKRRVGFIPRSNVLFIINKLSHESNLSYSKIINILVEEALYKRGLFDIINDEIVNNYEKNEDNKIHTIRENVKNEFTNNFRDNLLEDNNLNLNEMKDTSLDKEIYAKFLIFLQFQERMKQEDL